MNESIMLDLETLGTKPGSIILSIGAVSFNGIGIQRNFYERIDLKSCEKYGMTVSLDTIAWWMKQDKQAQDEAFSNGKSLAYVLGSFSEWLKSFNDDIEIWGNGSDFDNLLLSSAYEIVGIDCPWNYWQNRCYKTIRAMFGTGIKTERKTQKHNALLDAEYQALHLIEIMKKIKA